MPDLDIIRKQLEEAMAARQEVTDYERAQQQAEIARQQQLTRSEQDIARLRQMEFQAHWQNDVQHNAVLVQLNHDAITAFQQQMTEFVDSVMELLSGLSAVAIDETSLEQQQHAHNAVARQWDGELERLRSQQPNTSENVLHMEVNRILKQKHHSLRLALPLRSVLLEIISHTADENKKRVLQGIAVMLTGEMMYPPNNITREALEDDVRRRTIP